MSSRERARALVLHATSVPVGWPRVLADTVRNRTPNALNRLLQPLRRWRYPRFYLGDEYERLSYVPDWRDAWAAAPGLSVDLCDINDLWATARARRRIPGYELVVVLHSAAGDNLSRARALEPLLQRRKAPLVIFFGNEYVRMPEKIAFTRSVEAEYIASQLPSDAAAWLYADCRSHILHAPAALNAAVYRPLGLPRGVDLGFRGDVYQHAYALGDVDRTRVLELFRQSAAGLGLTVDIEYQRVNRNDWNLLLNRWHGVVGAESGARFLERDDRTRSAVVAFLQDNPAATWEDVQRRFFADGAAAVSGKAISSRHFEPAGTGTCQVLVEGRYNDILRPGEHYISLRRDHSNLDEVVAAFKDTGYRRRIADQHRELVTGAHTYAHRVEAVLKAVLAA